MWKILLVNVNVIYLCTFNFVGVFNFILFYFIFFSV